MKTISLFDLHKKITMNLDSTGPYLQLINAIILEAKNTSEDFEYKLHDNEEEMIKETNANKDYWYYYFCFHANYINQGREMSYIKENENDLIRDALVICHSTQLETLENSIKKQYGDSAVWECKEVSDKPQIEEIIEEKAIAWMLYPLLYFSSLGYDLAHVENLLNCTETAFAFYEYSFSIISNVQSLLEEYTIVEWEQYLSN